MDVEVGGGSLSIREWRSEGRRAWQGAGETKQGQCRHGGKAMLLSLVVKTVSLGRPECSGKCFPLLPEGNGSLFFPSPTSSHLPAMID